MAQVKIHSGVWGMIWQPKKASTAFTEGELLELAAGFVEPADSSTAVVFGVNRDSTVASSSTTTEKIPVLVPRGLGLVEMDVSGTLTASQVGGNYDLEDSQTVNTGATSNPVARIERITDSTNKRALVAINPFIRA